MINAYKYDSRVIEEKMMALAKRFVIAKKHIDDMVSIRLSNGFICSYDKDLKIRSSADNRFVLIGECWSTRPGEDPEEFIAQSSGMKEREILEAEYYWCGRYVLVLDDKVYMDAGGLMSIFYDDMYVSNSLNLICDLENYKIKKERVFRGIAPDYVPGILTQYKNVKRLLPSLIYDYTQKKISIRKLIPFDEIECSNENDRIHYFIETFKTNLVNLDKHFADKKKLIACTGGRDSRVTLAISEYANLPFDVCLLEHDSISEADVSISIQLSKMLDRKHHYIKRNKAEFSRKKLQQFDKCTCNYVCDQDRLFFAYGQYEKLKTEMGSGIVVIRSSVWGRLNELYKIDSLIDFKNIFPILRYNKRYCDSINEWIGVIGQDTLNNNLSDANRFFWEMREGCWLSSIEQTFDLYDDVVSVQPLNSRRLLSILSGFNIEDRKRKKHEEKITNVACLKIAKIPYDYAFKCTDKHNIFRIIKRKKVSIDKAMWLFVHYGFKGLCGMYGNKAKRGKISIPN